MSLSSQTFVPRCYVSESGATCRPTSRHSLLTCCGQFVPDYLTSHYLNQTDQSHAIAPNSADKPRRSQEVFTRGSRRFNECQVYSRNARGDDYMHEDKNIGNERCYVLPVFQ